MPVLNDFLHTLSSDRVDFEGSLSRAEIDSLITNRKLKVLQTSEMVKPATWDLLNSSLFVKRKDVTLRIYDVFYSRKYDLSFLSRLPNLQHLSVDSFRDVTGLENIAALSKLKSLTIGVFNLTSFDFLQAVPESTLENLSLRSTKSKKAGLDKLLRFKKLKALHLEGQQNGIELIAELRTLRDLKLRKISVKGVDFLRDLGRLESLCIELGGIHDLSAIAGMTGISHLELFQVRDLRSIDVISTLTGLQQFVLENLPHIAKLPDLSKLRALKRMYLNNLKGLRDIRSLTTAPSLEAVLHFSANGIDPTQYRQVLKKSSIKRISVGFGSLEKDKKLNDYALTLGIEPSRRNRLSFM
jgi:hypothetical protein